MTLSYGLIGYYKLDGNGKDHGPNKLHGTLVNAPTVDIGKLKQCLRFNGTNQYVDLDPDGTEVLFKPNNISIAAWVSPDSVPDANHRTILTKRTWWGGASGGDDWNYNLRLYQSNWQFQLSTLGGNTTVNAAAAAGFSHLVATYDSSIMKLYVNGVLISVDTSLSGAIDYSVNSYPVRIGAQSTNQLTPWVTDEWYDGLIDEVGIWNWALSPGHVAALYNGGDGLPFEAFPTAYPEFDIKNARRNIRPYWIVDIEGLPKRYVHRS